MEQKLSDKTIVFAMKPLGIALLMAGRSDFPIETTIPVDSRIRSFTERIGVSAENDGTVRAFWKGELAWILKNSRVAKYTTLNSEDLLD